MGYSLSAIGTGLAIPFLTIYLHQTVGLTGAQLSLFFAVMAGSGLIANPVAGRIADVAPPVLVLVTALMTQTMGWGLLALVSNAPWAVAAAVVIGTGNGMFFAVQLAAVRLLFDPDALDDLFATQYRLSNLFIAVPQAVLATVALTGNSGWLRTLVVLNAVSFFLFAVILCLLGRDRPPPTAQAPRARLAFAAFRDRRFSPLLLVQFVAIAFCVGPFNTLLPVLMTGYGGMPVAVVAVIFIVNPVAVVLVGGFGKRYVRRHGERSALLLAFTGFAASGLVLVAALLLDGPASIVAYLLYSAVFAIPEVLLAPAVQPLAARLMPDHSAGRYSAALSLMYGVGLLVGPPTFLLLQSMNTAVAVVLLIAAPLISLPTVVRLPRHEPDLQRA
ncbi:MFS transporter [Actinoplanes sp. NEAU-A12]|uniref:MFS transporter n=1 Tax=Actinoplanes sandaracinus TaxID=3045177 RepID=A0ABT6WRA8_9ACTN|nr:MFS transporter [Actinoplanes sandaracinus]MDI6102277.1 MFS transporter [Actinoplanes sandaracinus]